MRRGDRVATPRGPGVVNGEWVETVHVFDKTHRRVWLLVELDADGATVPFNPTVLTREEAS